jgi:hypothetical protein
MSHSPAVPHSQAAFHQTLRARARDPKTPAPSRSAISSEELEVTEAQVNDSATGVDSRQPAGEGQVGSRPARGYSWPQAEPGNTLATKHGAYSERAIAERAGEVHAALLEVAPWCDEDRYLPSVHRYLQATAREQLAHEALMANTKLSPRLLETATAAARLAWSMGDQLGLTPAGHARLKLLVAGATGAEHTLADLMAEGRQIRKAAEARHAAQAAQLPATAAQLPPAGTEGEET